MEKRKLKPIPDFKNEDEERDFWASHEIVDYVDTSRPIEMDLSHLKPSTQTITLRVPEGMVRDLKSIANKHDVPYQSLIKMYLAKMIRAEHQWR